MTLGRVSKRIGAIYDRFYADREGVRFENLYMIFDRMAANVEAGMSGVKLAIDYVALAEIVRSYFLDTIRYKEYHFDPKSLPEGDHESEKRIAAFLKELGCKSIHELDPMSAEWSELVHSTVNINSSKVAAYTVKWILRYKPIVVYHSGDEIFDPNAKDLREERRYSGFLANVNEHYALQCALVALGIRADKIPRNKIDELIYCFRFRAFDESAYFMILSRDYLYAGQEE